MSDHNLLARLSHRNSILTSPIYAIVPRYVEYLHSRRYAYDTIQSYLASLAHFAHWLGEHRFCISDINDALVAEFVDTHLPSCSCPRPCMHRAATIHAALQHLLGILKVQNLGCGIQEQTPIDIELEIYDSLKKSVGEFRFG